nr:porin [Pseudomonadota bacterium]
LLTSPASGDSRSSAFNGRTRVTVADFVWKWAPNGNATRTSFKLQGEYLRSARDGAAVVGASGHAQSGAYLQAIYQFMPRWRVGLRTERLDSGSVTDPDLLSSAVYRPRKESLMLDFNPSEFSRVRLQLARDRSRVGVPDNQLLLQYQMSLGAHGAHGF